MTCSELPENVYLLSVIVSDHGKPLRQFYCINYSSDRLFVTFIEIINRVYFQITDVNINMSKELKDFNRSVKRKKVKDILLGNTVILY